MSHGMSHDPWGSNKRYTLFSMLGCLSIRKRILHRYHTKRQRKRRQLRRVSRRRCDSDPEQVYYLSSDDAFSNNNLVTFTSQMSLDSVTSFESFKAQDYSSRTLDSIECKFGLTFGVHVLDVSYSTIHMCIVVLV